jgi:hypothetical protein
MKTLRKAFIILLLCIPLSGMPGKATIYLEYPEPLQPYEKLWKATCEVESDSNPLAYCIDVNNKPSVGIVQI